MSNSIELIKNALNFRAIFEVTLNEMNSLKVWTDQKKTIYRIEKNYSSAGQFSQAELYVMYDIFFQIWASQHRELVKQTSQYDDMKSLIVEHLTLISNIWHDFQAIEINSTINSGELRDSCLNVWKMGCTELLSFNDSLPEVPLPKKLIAENKFSLFQWFREFYRNNPAEAILTLTFVVGIIIAIILSLKAK